MARWIKKWDVKGSAGNVYVVSIDDEGNYGCSCPVWKFKRKVCKHITYIMDRAEAEGLQGSVVREARPGNVGEVTIDGDVALYPLMPFPINTDLVATIIYDLIRAGVDIQRVEEYRDSMFKKKVPIKRITDIVKSRGRYVYTRFEDGKGWIGLSYVPCDTPLKDMSQLEANQQEIDMINQWRNTTVTEAWF